MLIWCGILFGLGIMAFADTILTFGEIFRQVNSVFFMLVSLGLLVRTTTKIRRAAMEKQVERLSSLEEEISAMRREKTESGRTDRQRQIAS